MTLAPPSSCKKRIEYYCPEDSSYSDCRCSNNTGKAADMWTYCKAAGSGCNYGGREWSKGTVLGPYILLHLQIAHCLYWVASSIHNPKLIPNQAIFVYVFLYISDKLKICLLSFPFFLAMPCVSSSIFQSQYFKCVKFFGTFIWVAGSYPAFPWVVLWYISSFFGFLVTGLSLTTVTLGNNLWLLATESGYSA